MMQRANPCLLKTKLSVSLAHKGRGPRPGLGFVVFFFSFFSGHAGLQVGVHYCKQSFV